MSYYNWPSTTKVPNPLTRLSEPSPKLLGLSPLEFSESSKQLFSCSEINCPKTYSTHGALKMHLKTHTLPCKCPTCGKAFSRPWLLQGHIRTHTGEKPFGCDDCPRRFADRSNLRAHQQTHATVKKYKCDMCPKTFSRMSLLTKHKQGACIRTRVGGSSAVN